MRKKLPKTCLKAFASLADDEHISTFVETNNRILHNIWWERLTHISYSRSRIKRNRDDDEFNLNTAMSRTRMEYEWFSDQDQIVPKVHVFSGCERKDIRRQMRLTKRRRDVDLIGKTITTTSSWTDTTETLIFSSTTAKDQNRGNLQQYSDTRYSNLSRKCANVLS